MNQQMHTIISQIITLLHVSTLSCHPQAACNQYLAQLHQYFVQWPNKCTQLFHKLSHCYMFRYYRVILRQPLINTLPSYTSILYNELTNAHNYFTNYHTATCFDTIVSSSDSLYSIPCPFTPVICTMTQQRHTIISQIITLLHVSTLSCYPQTACNQYFAKLHQYTKFCC